MAGPGKVIVQDNILTAGELCLPVGSPAWFEWLATARRFSFKGPRGSFVAQCEKRRSKDYWYAYRRAGRLTKVYLGKAEDLTPERLEWAAISLTGQTLLKQLADQPAGAGEPSSEARMDASLVPLTRINAPVLPHQMVARPRLTRRINTPLTVICAPSGFGKSTLLNDWKQTCGHPVAWLSLDESDNEVNRFWHSVTMALQTVDPELGRDLLAYLDTAPVVQSVEVVARLSNDLIHRQVSLPRLGLVLDDFQRISRAAVFDSVQVWLEHQPSNLQLVILGHTNPPLSLGHLRAKGRLTELDAGDLRFTLEEGIDYLRQCHQETPLAYDDLAKLVKHTEGWAAGLTLTALALGRQEDHRQFVDTFSGAHIYLREYFMETVLQRSSPEVQDFLLKTAVLKNLTGSLCDAVTGQTGGADMLLHLWQENLFIVRLEEQGWYRYHDLFAEMLLSQLQAHHADEVPQLHQRAARWYREQYAPADAIFHLLAIEAWEEAALLMEEMALRELEGYGEDSRLLRWLQKLPAGVVQKHRTLLFLYLRLAQVALGRQEIERFVNQIATGLSQKPASRLTHDEEEVLKEIQTIRRIWEKGDPFTPPARDGSENDAKWELLSELQLLQLAYRPHAATLEDQIAGLLHRAQTQRNLFVILMAGGVLARRNCIKGQLRRSERIARQVLEQALAQRGKLPEPSSIALGVLSQVYWERNDLGLAQKYLTQALDVDPNPTSTNMLVQIAIQRSGMQSAQGNYKDALANIRSMRELHMRRPSGGWTDQDLAAYEAFIHIRMGDLAAATRLLDGSGEAEEHGLSKLARAEVLLGMGQPEAAGELLDRLLEQYPEGLPSEPAMRARVLLARALFEQHKVNLALQAIKEAVRLAAPEGFLRPFLEDGVLCAPLLSLAQQAENLTGEARTFIKELLRLSKHTPEAVQLSQDELAALSATASISQREQEVLRLVSAGYSNREMAKKLSISESTVKTHVSNIYAKLDVNSRIQAITRAKELKLI